MTQPLRPQHMQALNRANEIRLYRAALKAEVRSDTGPDQFEAGRIKLATILLFPAEERDSINSLRVVEFLKWGRKMQGPSAVRYAAACGISEWAMLGQITDRQRLKLAELLREGLAGLHSAESENEIARWVAERNRRAA